MAETVQDLAQRFFGCDAGDLGERELNVLLRVAERAPLARNVEQIAAGKATFWDRLADRVAAIGGSWAFIFGFFTVLAAWVTVNGSALLGRGLVFDPYPFIFLNLVLSMLAAIQAPIIMMSQNRAAAKDRIAAEHDYEINLRAELEIMQLHEKLDAMRTEQRAALQEHQSEMAKLLRGAAGSASRA